MFMNFKLPSIAYFLIITIAIGWIMYVGSSILQPLFYGVLLAIILNPIEKRIRSKFKFPLLSIIATFLLVLVPISLIFYIFYWQLSSIMESLPAVSTSLQGLVAKITAQLQEIFPMLKENESLLTSSNIQNHLDGPLNVLQTGIMSSSQVLFSSALALLYTFFFIYYSKSFKSFIIHQFGKSSRPEIRDTILKIRSTIQSYIGGLGIVIIILSVLNSLGLWIIGVDYALFWGILAGFLAVIPYIGTLVGGLLPFLYSIATADYSWQPGAVAVYYFVIQQVEGNIITPKIVGKQVDLNPLFAIFALVLFGSIWGVGGVILSIPLMAVIRIIFEHFEETEAIAVLMSSSIAEEAETFKEIADG